MHDHDFYDCYDSYDLPDYYDVDCIVLIQIPLYGRRKANYKHAEITEKIIGLAMKVHSKLGLGFPEKIYQRSLEIELKAAGMVVESEKSQPIYYEGN